MPEQPSTRRQFLKTCGRFCGAAVVAGAAGGLVWRRAAADKVWQIDPQLCETCRNYLDEEGWAKCATECVLKRSAVRAVNDFSQCGYCLICPGYHDVNSPPDEHGVPTGKVCPQDAITRTAVGAFDAADPANNYFQYTIDETKCNGCGKCVENCRPHMGNGSLRLEVRHDLCLDCNECSIAKACPYDAFVRQPVVGKNGGYFKPPAKDPGH